MDDGGRKQGELGVKVEPEKINPIQTMQMSVQMSEGQNLGLEHRFESKKEGEDRAYTGQDYKNQQKTEKGTPQKEAMMMEEEQRNDLKRRDIGDIPFEEPKEEQREMDGDLESKGDFYFPESERAIVNPMRVSGGGETAPGSHQEQLMQLKKESAKEKEPEVEISERLSKKKLSLEDSPDEDSEMPKVMIMERYVPQRFDGSDQHEHIKLKKVEEEETTIKHPPERVIVEPIKGFESTKEKKKCCCQLI